MFIDEFGVVEAFHIGGHGSVDGGIEFAQKRHEAVANLVATGVEFSIGAVLDIVEVVFCYIGIDVGAGEAEQRSDDCDWLGDWVTG